MFSVQLEKRDTMLKFKSKNSKFKKVRREMKEGKSKTGNEKREMYGF